MRQLCCVALRDLTFNGTQGSKPVLQMKEALPILRLAQMEDCRPDLSMVHFPGTPIARENARFLTPDAVRPCGLARWPT